MAGQGLPMRAGGWLMLMLSWGAVPASAMQLVAHVVDAQGHGVSDAVITLASEQGLPLPPSAAAAPTTHIIDQKNETFIPYVQIFRPGDKVVFRNSDSTRHHVYSFSKVRRFDFMLRIGESSPPIALDKPGIAAVGCNIHDQMVTYLYVSAATAIARSNQNGNAVIDNLAAGRYVATVWHPQLQPDKPAPTQRVVISDGAPANLSFTLSLTPDPRAETDDEHVGY